MVVGSGFRRAALTWLATSGLAAATVLCAGSLGSQKVQADDRVVPEARIESTRGLALGTGARASAASTQAQAENPANLVVGGLYHLETFFGYQPNFNRIGWGAAVADSMTSRLAAGASARGIFGDNSAGDNSGWEAKVSLAFPISDMLSLGISGRYARYTIADQRAIPERKPELDMKPDQLFKLKAFTMDASITLRPIAGLSISALSYNLIDTKSPLAPLTVGGSAAYSVVGSGFGFGGDVLVDLNTHKAFNGPRLTMGGGLEFLAQGTIPLRAGYIYDAGRDQHGVTAGLGYIDQHVGVQASIRQIVVGGNETTLMGALQYFVQ
jgi:hypothetical protein